MIVLEIMCYSTVILGVIFACCLYFCKVTNRPIPFAKPKSEEMDVHKIHQISKGISNILKKDIIPDLELIKMQNETQNSVIDVLVGTTRDLLREAILNLYNNNKDKRILSVSEKAFLDDLYHDYRAENGNSYIEHVYNRMCAWTIVPDEDKE